MQIALYRKYRPGRFADLVGQEPIKLTLANQVRAGAVGHAYIFAGPKGTGKTTVARILAKAVNCLENSPGSVPLSIGTMPGGAVNKNKSTGDPCGKCALCVAADEGSMMDLIEIDGASNNGIENIRELIDKIYISPAMGKYKVYVIDEAHMLSKPAFNALLKTLEEPPAHAIFVLATTEIDKFPATIVSRCQRFDFRPIKLVDVIAYLEKVAKAENIDITADGIALIAEQSGGGMRDALSLLERAMAMGTTVDAQSLTSWFGIVSWSELIHLTEMVIAGDRKSALQVIDSAYRNGYDLARLASSWMGIVRTIVGAKLGNTADLGLVEESADRLQSLADKITYEQSLWWLEEMLELATKVKRSTVPQLPLEIMVLKAIEKLAGQPYLSAGRQVGGLAGQDGGSGKQEGESIQSHQSAPISSKGREDEEVLGSRLAGKQVSGEEDKIETANLEVAQATEVDWAGIVAFVKKQSPTLGAVLENAKWEVVDGAIWVGLANQFYLNKLAEPNSRVLVSGALKSVGVELKVEYRLDSAKVINRSAVDPQLVGELFG